MANATPTTRTLLLVRHPRVIDAEGLCYGRLDLAAAAADTQRVARELLPRLSGIERIHCSPRQRCVAVAQALCRLQTGLQVVIDARLAEMDFGRWEGRRWQDLARDELDAWAADFCGYRAGGNGETVRQFFDRVALAHADWRRHDRRELWLTHAGVVRAMRLLMAGFDCPAAASDWPAEAVPYGECLRLREVCYLPGLNQPARASAPAGHGCGDQDAAVRPEGQDRGSDRR